ncbi:hypothetical protein DICVIV_01343 [Dictyocaulus viviparus]|uniref:Uncharacterized protein n=1 Tax=Dictyocaulus viviparus TaxID=29172 RepID=A0A0D8Y8G8_DICVI|nr:hypothetical protein DICVIV_01343 [Dictyocaulus viviparus]
MHFWHRVLLVCCFVMLLLANDQQPDKKPAFLSRYGRAVLSRYGKRSPRVVSPDNELVLCRNVNGEFECKPYNDDDSNE